MKTTTPSIRVLMKPPVAMSLRTRVAFQRARFDGESYSARERVRDDLRYQWSW